MKFNRFSKRMISGLALVALVPFCSAEPLTLEQAVIRANAIDPWITGSEKQQESLEAMSIQAGTLPDPNLNFTIANLPVDTFDFSQEGMTQFKVGISQMFPRGKSRALKREKLSAMSKVQPHARAERRASVRKQVSQLWLEVYRQQRIIALIEEDRHLFEHLVDVSQSSYTTASGKARQQDLVRAQLELTRLDDRLTRLRQMRDMYTFQLGEWLSLSGFSLADNAVAIEPTVPHLLLAKGEVRAELLGTYLLLHPMIQMIDQKLVSADTSIKLADQGYKPQWGLNASYGYRDEDPMGRDRADFFSAGVTFDIPLFTGKRQDQVVKSARAERETVKTERALALRKLRSNYETAESGYLQLLERKRLFDSRLLREMAEQAEASLTAYTNDDGDFAEVVRARIAELNAQIDALNIDIDIQKSIAQMNYFLDGVKSSGANNE